MSTEMANASAPAAVRKSGGWAIVIGILMVLLGILMIMTPLPSGLVVTVAIGLLFMVGGTLQIVHGVNEGFWSVVTGILAFICGLLLFARPFQGMEFLTLFLAFYFFFDGAALLAFSFRLRPRSGWGWMLFNALVTILLGVLILFEWPLSGAWAIGTLAGVSFIMRGWTMVALGSFVRSL
jgi:uncharacterized membrane protein HdeD (DUF308 family)